MPIDPQRIGTMAMEFIESLEQKYGDEADIETLAVIAAVHRGSQTTIEFRFQSAGGGGVPTHVCRGLLAEVDRGITLHNQDG